jgi:hypothetical protein
VSMAVSRPGSTSVGAAGSVAGSAASDPDGGKLPDWASALCANNTVIKHVEREIQIAGVVRLMADDCITILCNQCNQDVCDQTFVTEPRVGCPPFTRRCSIDGARERCDFNPKRT